VVRTDFSLHNIFMYYKTNFSQFRCIFHEMVDFSH
jgi:hypothetical protein